MKNPKPPPKTSKPPPLPKPKPSSSSSSSRKSRWEPAAAAEKPTSSSPKPPPSTSHPKPPAPSSSAAPSPALRPPPHQETPPAPPYGFHNLDRRTMVLADGSVRSYFALPPDYPLPDAAQGRVVPAYPPSGLPPLPFDRGPFPPPPFPHGGDYWPPLSGGGIDGKRKYTADADDELARHRQHVLQYGGNSSANPNGSYDDGFRPRKQARLGGGGDAVPAHLDVDRHALRRVYLKYAKMINESAAQRRSYLEDGRSGGRLQCLACGRASKDFADVHGLIMHAYNPPHADSDVDHLGLHKALCVFMGWDYAKVPENSKAYQSLPADIAQANREDLIVWPPTVIIHNTSTGRKKDGRVEGLGNKDMDMKIKELGFPDGKSKSLYGKEGHLGVTLVKFANSQAGLKEAEHLAEFLEREDHGRRGWSRAQATRSVDTDKNPLLVKRDDRTGEKKRIFYGYLAIASDLDELDSDSRKRAFLKSRMEFDLSD